MHCSKECQYWYGNTLHGYELRNRAFRQDLEYTQLTFSTPPTFTNPFLSFCSEKGFCSRHPFHQIISPLPFLSRKREFGESNKNGNKKDNSQSRIFPSWTATTSWWRQRIYRAFFGDPFCASEGFVDGKDRSCPLFFIISGWFLQSGVNPSAFK